MFQVSRQSPSSSSSWQEAMVFASQEAFREAYKHNDDNASLFSMAVHCPSDFSSDEACVCNSELRAQMLLLKILRWIKLIVLKLAASYYALPIILAILPLALGLLVGFCLGRTTSRSQDRRTRLPAITSWPWSLFYSICQSISFRRLIQQSFPCTDLEMIQREENARQDLRSDRESVCESGVDADRVPKHVAIIMDGNRRYGKQVYGNATSGHWDGSRKVLQVAKWCIAENVRVLTVFAFSTENWRREPTEVASLMALFVKYCEELRVEAIRRNIRVRILSTDASKVPAHVKAGFDKLQSDTEHCEGGLDMNICLSYGSRGELVSACRELAKECVAGNRDADSISEEDVQGALLTRHTCDPDVLIRTSGEERISNFLLWQLAYTELFFLDKHWPEFEKDDLLKVIRTFASGRERRYGA